MVQVHPSLRCNLRCLHCYSASGPEERGALPVGLLRDALVDAAAEGYRALSVSGGEPLLYAGLEELLGQARALGWLTTLTTNGTLLRPRLLERLRPSLDFVAVSLDGAPESHDRVRGRRGAFERMRAGLRVLRALGLPFGVVFTLRADNVQEIGFAAGFALDEGASVLQIHPLAEAGRAALGLPGLAPSPVDRVAAWITAAELRRALGGRVAVHVDLVDTAALRTMPTCAVEAPERLGDWVSPLVIEEDGLVVPLQHGFPRGHALGRLTELPLRALAGRWRGRGAARFEGLIERTLRSLRREDSGPLVDWYAELALEARRAA